MRVMVTGGAGFIGSALVRHLVGEVGADVLNIDKLTYAGNLDSLKPIANAPNHRFLKADICDRAGHDRGVPDLRAGLRHASCCRKPCRSIDHRRG